MLSCFFQQKPKILFYGSRGWIGGMFQEYLVKNDIEVIEGTKPILTATSIVTDIKVYKPTHIVSFIGRTHGIIDNKPVNTIDYLEHPGKLVENVRDNLFIPINFAMICKEYGIHFTYLGTGCIFTSSGLDTDTPQQFKENDLPNFFGSSYSVVKGFTDRLMHRFNVLNLRIRMPISSKPNDRNFINKIAKYEKICSIPNSMTILDDFFPIFMDLIIKKKTGTYNCTNPGLITHDEVLSLYRETIDPSFTWINFSKQEQDEILKSDRSNNFLNTDKIEKKYNVPNIKKSMLSVMLKMKKEKK